MINILMNYLLDRYIFAYLPFEVSDELKHSFASAGMSTVKFADWFCKTQDIRKFYGNHTSFLAIEFLYPLLCLMTLIHAYRHGGRYLYTWIGTTIYALAAASLYLWSPNFDYQWNAQGLLSFLGGRAPLSAIFGTQQLFFYVAFVFIQRMHLPSLVQGPATGIAVLLLKIPYHIIGTKLIFWTWQIDNPVFADKIYGVPWIIFVFDVGSACGFVWWLKFSRAFLLPGFYDWKKFVREFLCSTIAAFGGLLFGIALSILLFSTVQLLRLPMSVAVSAFICLHFIIVYIADRNNKNAESRAGNDYWFDELSLATCIHFIFLMMLILGAQSLNPIVSEGIHQPIGSCKAYSRIELPLGKILERQDFLCLKTLDSDHFNFHCLPGRKPPSVDGNDLLEWYPICGKPMNAEIHAEYIAIIWGICLIAATILYQAAAKSGKTPKIYRVIYQSPNRATKKFN